MTEEKKKAGQPPHIPTDKNRQTVQMLSAMKISQGVIAKTLGIGKVTLRKKYRSELDNGKELIGVLASEQLLETLRVAGGDSQHWPALKKTLEVIFPDSFRETQKIDITSDGESMSGGLLFLPKVQE